MPSAPGEDPKSTNTSTNVTTRGNKFEPRPVRGNDIRTPEKVAGLVKSVTDRTNSAISRSIDWMKGGGADNGEVSTGGPSEASTGGTSADTDGQGAD